jgi:hypothetical protein
VFPVSFELGIYIPEDDILRIHRRENFKSCIIEVDIPYTICLARVLLYQLQWFVPFNCFSYVAICRSHRSVKTKKSIRSNVWMKSVTNLEIEVMGLSCSTNGRIYKI